MDITHPTITFSAASGDTTGSGAAAYAILGGEDIWERADLDIESKESLSNNHSFVTFINKQEDNNPIGNGNPINSKTRLLKKFIFCEGPVLLRAIPLLVRLEIVYICLSADLRRGIMKMLPLKRLTLFGICRFLR